MISRVVDLAGRRTKVNRHLGYVVDEVESLVQRMLTEMSAGV